MSTQGTGPTRPTSCGSRESLREMGVIERIGYKRNIETFRGEVQREGEEGHLRQRVNDPGSLFLLFPAIVGLF